ncbi:MAG: lactonase family protein [Pseudobutyrivibrio ruminis]|nr:lactonase family protein [Pseudobutyrivibrio ruminis]
MKCYLYVGNWSFEPNPAKGKGISIFEYNSKDGNLSIIETIRPDIAAGQLYLDEKSEVLYSNDECGERKGEIGGGGYVHAFKIDKTDGSLKELNSQETLIPEPSYLCMDREGKYLIACHCADPFHVTKIKKNEDGSFTNEVLFDDTGLVMFSVEDDGSIGKIVDVALTESYCGKGVNSQKNVDPVSNHIQLVQVISRLHSVVANPAKEIFISCDKGMDRIYSYKIDYEKKSLVQLDCWKAPEVACFPRYLTFHPTKKLFYANNENYALLNSFKYDEATGKMERIDKTYLLEGDPGLVEGKPVGAQDIMMHPNGKVLYCTLCGINLIVVCEIDNEGIPHVIQRINSRGNLPRGLVISPDNKFLYSGNMVSGDITIFKIVDDGRLEDTGKTVSAISPSALKFFSIN